MPIYTKTGDKGITGMFSGKRVSKSSQLINAIGAVDELNSFLGIVGGLEDVQKNLFTINANLSGAKLNLPKDASEKLEKEIDEIEKKLPKQKNFLIYGGSSRAAKIYFARALTRRAERELVVLKLGEEILIYINRLSDYLFILARNVNYNKGVKETVWKTSK